MKEKYTQIKKIHILHHLLTSFIILLLLLPLPSIPSTTPQYSSADTRRTLFLVVIVLYSS